ncbi:MAG: FAD-binding oxidoreductase [Candidatus Brennerbacteria bacterium]|nr:FAD-binding oxidoreductase [Candidatus Brennerbacteria bacterium]
MIADEIKGLIKGEVLSDNETLDKYSRDASLFEVKPEAVVFPKDVEDLKRLVEYVGKHKRKNKTLSLTSRSGGSDMTGGPLGDSIIVDFTKHFNRLVVGMGYARVEPGVFYRDFEKETLKWDWILPTYPASRELCALGGMLANNAGGEKTLRYGKTARYVEEMKVVLADGNEYLIKPLTKKELAEKIKGQKFENEIYREIFQLVERNYEMIQKAKPNVSKNSAGYNLWDVWDKKTFDLTKLFVGSQGTLGIITEAKLRLVPVKKYSGLLVIFMKDLRVLPEIVRKTLELKPTSFESFDDHTFKLALKFFTGFLKVMGANIFSLALQFLPEFFRVLWNGMPKMILLAEFEEDSQKEVGRKIKELRRALKSFRLSTKAAPTAELSKKYWVMRRESFNLLRHKVKGLKAAPFIDDIIVRPEHLSEFLPRLYGILDRHGLLYTIAGHVGDGNFHIIPLMRLADEAERRKIPEVAREVYELVLEFNGSITAEHNDGLIRSPFLGEMYGKKVYDLFRRTKKIFDPLNIFNPGKKVGADLNYALEHISH